MRTYNVYNVKMYLVLEMLEVLNSVFEIFKMVNLFVGFESDSSIMYTLARIIAS